MDSFRPVFLWLLVFPLFGCGASAPRATDADDNLRRVEYDLVIYGGTSSGVTAAVQARRMGRSVLIIEPTGHLGGMTTNGLGATDIGNKAAIGGIAREFYRRVKHHYGRAGAWTLERREDFVGRGHSDEDDAAWTFEPGVAQQIIDELVRDSGADVWFHERLDRRGRGVTKDGVRVLSIRTENGHVVRGKVFIDSSYEGDLMAAAGASYRVGREGAGEFVETLNGVRTDRAEKHQFGFDVDPFASPGDRTSGLLPGVVAAVSGPDGAADHCVQAYCFRLCATDVASNSRPWPRPDGYDEGDYELLLRYFEAGFDSAPWHPVRMPNGKTDSNNNHAFSTDFIGANHDYPEADYATRARIVDAHRRYQQGLMWTLANHERVPVSVREHFQSYGLARDEFVDNGNWPRQLYVREARRMVGVTVMQQAHCVGERTVPDSIGLAAYTMDSHNVQRYVDSRGFCRNEGDVQVGGFGPYPIAYASIRSKPDECDNLLVPVCLSATHVAYGSIRMEPVFMVLGQSAATAACLAIERAVPLHEVSYSELRRRLLADQQVLTW